METKRKTSPLLIFARILFTGCLVYSIWFIFHNSLQIAQVSGEQSQRVQELLNALAAQVELCGAVCGLLCALPLIEQALELVGVL